MVKTFRPLFLTLQLLELIFVGLSAAVPVPADEGYQVIYRGYNPYELYSDGPDYQETRLHTIGERDAKPEARLVKQNGVWKYVPMAEGFGNDQERLTKREANPLLRLVNEDGVWKYVPMAVGFGKDQERLAKREASPLYTLVNENGIL